MCPVGAYQHIRGMYCSHVQSWENHKSHSLNWLTFHRHWIFKANGHCGVGGVTLEFSWIDPCFIGFICLFSGYQQWRGWSVWGWTITAVCCWCEECMELYLRSLTMPSWHVPGQVHLSGGFVKPLESEGGTNWLWPSHFLWLLDPSAVTLNELGSCRFCLHYRLRHVNLLNTQWRSVQMECIQKLSMMVNESKCIRRAVNSDTSHAVSNQCCHIR